MEDQADESPVAAQRPGDPRARRPVMGPGVPVRKSSPDADRLRSLGALEYLSDSLHGPVDLVLRDDQRRREPDGLLMRVLGQDSLIHQLLTKRPDCLLRT